LRSGRRLERLEYHLSHSAGKPQKEHFERKCQSKIYALLPIGTQVTFFRWQQRDGGAVMHARYVLTELGGVRFDYGLDEGEDGETADVVLLDRQRHSQLWQSFQVNEMVRNGQSTHLPYDYFDEVTVKRLS
jgi:stress response protein SCP2